MVSFEIFVKAMPPSLSELKVLPSFCFAFKIPDDVADTNTNMPIHFLPFLNIMKCFYWLSPTNAETVVVFKLQ